MGNSEENQGYQQSFHVVKDTYSQIQKFVLTKMRNAALKMALELFEQEVNELCGDKFSRKNSGQCHRGGSDGGRILLHGQRVQVKKPRVRKADEEVQLQSYSALTDYDLLCDRVMKHMLSGVSTRKYDGLCEEVAGGTGLKKEFSEPRVQEGLSRST